ncbi:MAG: hypothetical protein HY843_04925 [Bdellovibrio sp.]|nr:hypothetical protein [Bdellovibrio sp.]
MIVFLSEKINDLNSINRTNDDIKATLDDFCILDYGPGQVTETIQECKERYIALHDLWIIDARKAILQISDMAAKLNDSSTGDNGQWNFEIMRLVRNPPLKPQVPYLYTWADLEQISKNLKQAPDFNYDLYIDNLPTQLQKEDFVDYKEIPRDPKNPSLGTLSVIVRNNDGTPKYREKEYQAALKYFDPAFVAKMEKYKKIMKADKQRVLAQIREWDTKTAEKTTKLFQELSKTNTSQGGATTQNRNKQYIDDSRGKIIYSVNSQIKHKQNQKKDPKKDGNTHALDSRGVATAQQGPPQHFLGNESIDEAFTNVPGSDSTSIYIKGPVEIDWYNDWFKWHLSLPPPAPSP